MRKTIIIEPKEQKKDRTIAAKERLGGLRNESEKVINRITVSHKIFQKIFSVTSLKPQVKVNGSI